MNIVKSLSILIIVLLTSAMVLESAPSAEKGWGLTVSPSIIQIKGISGQKQAGVIKVSNEGELPLTVEMEIRDVANEIDGKGNFIRIFPEPGKTAYSCAQWISLSNKSLKLKPGESRDVFFSILAPEGESGEKAAMIFFKGVKRENKKWIFSRETNSPSIDPRLGVMVFYEIDGTVKREGKILDVSYEAPENDHPLTIRYKAENFGNAAILVSGEFYLADRNESFLDGGDLQSIRLFPGEEGFSQTEWKKPLDSAASYLVVTVNLDADKPKTVVRQFSLPVY